MVNKNVDNMSKNMSSQYNEETLLLSIEIDHCGFNQVLKSAEFYYPKEWDCLNLLSKRVGKLRSNILRLIGTTVWVKFGSYDFKVTAIGVKLYL